jgi:hypothetical protein
VFFVESEEDFAICPNCGEILVFHSRIIRNLRKKSGEKQRYRIRVLKCNNQSCPTTYHRELPDFIIAYRRFEAEAIEETISQKDAEITVSADQSTLFRWRQWFDRSATYIIMALLSVQATIENNTISSSLKIQGKKPRKLITEIKNIVARNDGWLNECSRILVNSSKWIINRSAFLSG